MEGPYLSSKPTVITNPHTLATLAATARYENARMSSVHWLAPFHLLASFYLLVHPLDYHSLLFTLSYHPGSIYPLLAHPLDYHSFSFTIFHVLYPNVLGRSTLSIHFHITNVHSITSSTSTMTARWGQQRGVVPSQLPLERPAVGQLGVDPPPPRRLPKPMWLRLPLPPLLLRKGWSLG